jgi:predicted dehydrogenase
MAIASLTPEQMETGKANFARAADGLTRRGFLKSLTIAGGAVAVAAPAAYFGYKGLEGLGGPIKVALIGAGDEGGVLIGQHNPKYLEIIAVCDVRPSNKIRAFKGELDPGSPRPGLNRIYNGNMEGKIKAYDDYLEMLKAHKGELDAVIIALPLHLHAKAAVDCMRFGKERGRPLHVLCEKLMAWNIGQCKKMIAVAKDTGSILSIGHQRHYSMLYSHAAEAVQSGILGDIKYIRALWHRNLTWPFSFEPKYLGDQMAPGVPQPIYRDGWYPPITVDDYNALNSTASKYHYDNLEQLIRWRTYRATGGGLMAELGSHQLDACSIFLGHVHPLAVSGVGTRSFFGPGKHARDIDDHVFVTYEFPGKNYFDPDDTHKVKGKNDRRKIKDEHDVVVVTYSSLSTNAFEQYGECITGSLGTLFVEGERSLMLYPEIDPKSRSKAQPRGMEVGVSPTGSGKPVLDTGSTWSLGSGPAPGAAAAGPAGTSNAPVSRGYKEEMEDFAYCVRLWDQKLGYTRKGDGYEQRLPRCHGEVALVDAIIALTANRAMQERKRIEFDDLWFDAEALDEVPDDPKMPPKVAVE